MNCTRCKSSNKVKKGFVRSRQRYNCKDCGYNYSVLKKSTAKPNYLKRRALVLYLEGLDLRSIGRILQVSHVSVYQWIKTFGPKLTSLKREDLSKKGDSLKVVELHEMHSYIRDEKTTVGYRWLLIDLKKDLFTSYLA